MKISKKKVIVAAALVAVASTYAEDITLARLGNLTAGNHYRIMMICRKDTKVSGVLDKKVNRAGEGWYVEKEKELYATYHRPEDNQFVYYVGSHEGAKVNKSVAGGAPTFKQDFAAEPAECRMYFVVKYP